MKKLILILSLFLFILLTGCVQQQGNPLDRNADQNVVMLYHDQNIYGNVFFDQGVLINSDLNVVGTINAGNFDDGITYEALVMETPLTYCKMKFIKGLLISSDC